MCMKNYVSILQRRIKLKDLLKTTLKSSLIQLLLWELDEELKFLEEKWMKNYDNRRNKKL